MTLADLSGIAGVISGLAVLGSLIYLGVQTHQNSKHTKALIQQGRAALSTTGMSQLVAADSSLAEAFLLGVEGDPKMDRLQFVRFYFAMSSTFFIWEDLYYQHEAGLVEDDRHSATAMTIKFLLNGRGALAIWRISSANLGADFRAFVEGLLSESTADGLVASDPFDIWKALIAQSQNLTPNPLGATMPNSDIPLGATP